MLTANCSVLIAGGGPCGLVTALVLGLHGVPCRIVERHERPLQHPKAMGLMQRTAELLRLWGLESEARTRAVPDPWNQSRHWMTTLAAECVATTTLPRPPGDDPFSPTTAFRCPQYAVEDILRKHLRTLPSVQFDTEIELETWAQNDAHISATLVHRHSGLQERVQADWLVAADGTDSRIRSDCGIPFEGTADMGHFLNVYHRAPLEPLLRSRPGWGYMVASHQTGGAFLAVNGQDLWIYHHFLSPHETMADYPDHRCQDLIRRMSGVPDLPVEILSVKPWTMGAQVAQRFRHGRVLLTGDAAHRTTPDGGVGMNTGIQSAHNLAWKLAGVVQGWAQPDLLDTYESERRPVAIRNITFSQHNAGGTREIITAILTGDLSGARQLVHERRERPERYGLDLGYTYESGALVPDGSKLPEVADPVADYIPNARPGCRAPHLWVQHQGKRCSLLDGFGSQSVLLCGLQGRWLESDPATEVSSIPWLHRSIGPDQEWSANPNAFEALYGIGPTGAVLVRPDGFVAARVPDDTKPSQAIIQEGLRRLTGRLT